MTPLHYAAVYATSVVVFFAVDMVWLGVVAASFYKNQLGSLLGPVNWPVAILFYLLFLIGLSVFVIIPALSGGGLGYALLYGALFGFFTYATYDLTNWATLRDWPWLVAVVDMLWGSTLSAVVAGVTYWFARAFILH